MFYRDALEAKGRKVIYNGEEYVFLEIVRKRSRFPDGSANPFQKWDYDGLIYHEGRRAGRMVPLSDLSPAPRDAFRMRMQFGEKPRAEAEEIRLDA